MEDRARILEDRVEDLTREIVRTINEAEEVPGRPSLRAELKDFALSLLQDGVVSPETAAAESVAGVAAQFNPLGMAIPLVFAGVVLIFLFPPIGVLLFVGAAMMIVWGLVVSVVARR